MFLSKNLGKLSIATILTLTSLSAEQVDIAKSDLGNALNKLAHQTGVQLMVNPYLVEGKKAESLKGDYTAKEAFKLLLINSNLEANFEGDRVIIKEKPSQNSLGSVDIYERAGKTEGVESYTTTSMATSTKMDLSILDTPQSVSVITNQKLKDFGLTTIEDALFTTTGVTVERLETDRSTFTSRGFDIKNIQVDGVSLPLNSYAKDGATDLTIYDRVEITKGATGLISGPGAPSATVNLVLKRPTQETKQDVSITLGSWDKKRVELDVSGAINSTVKNRTILAQEKANSYLDRYSKNNFLAYSIFEIDLSDSVTLSTGFSRYAQRQDSPLWGSLALFYTDGTPTNYDRSTSTSSNWSFWNFTTTEAFAELQNKLENGWTSKLVVKQIQKTQSSNLFYVYGTPDPDTGLGLTGYASDYALDNSEKLVDYLLKGDYSLGGFTNQAMFGLSKSKRKFTHTSLYDYTSGNGFPAMPDMNVWDGNSPYPTFEAKDGGTVYHEQETLYGASNIHLAEPLKMVIGARATNWKSTGSAYSEDKSTDESGVINPYLGFVYDLGENATLYSSYSTTFEPQNKVDVNQKPLDPTIGKNYEAGVKSQHFDNSLNFSFAMFKTEQEDVAELAGKFDNGRDYHKNVGGIKSDGYEFDISGEIQEGFSLSLGYTDISIEDKDGKVTKTYVPKKSIKLATTYKPTSMPKLKLGANINWQNKIYKEQGVTTTGDNIGSKITTTQEAYSLVNLMASYEVNKALTTSLNIKNLTDKKYYSSLYWAQSYYGAPRSFEVTANWKF